MKTRVTKDTGIDRRQLKRQRATEKDANLIIKNIFVRLKINHVIFRRLPSHPILRMNKQNK